MKIKGQSFDTPEPVSVMLPHGNQDVQILCGCVVDYDLFNAMCPAPSPPQVLKPGGVKEVNINDTKYLEQVGEHTKVRTYWLVKESLKATEGLVFDGVDDDNPSTWPELEKEMVTAFGEMGMAKVIQAVLRANGLSDSLMSQARDSFLASQSLLRKG